MKHRSNRYFVREGGGLTRFHLRRQLYFPINLLEEQVCPEREGGCSLCISLARLEGTCIEVQVSISCCVSIHKLKRCRTFSVAFSFFKAIFHLGFGNLMEDKYPFAPGATAGPAQQKRNLLPKDTTQVMFPKINRKQKFVNKFCIRLNQLILILQRSYFHFHEINNTGSHPCKVFNFLNVAFR